LGLIYLVGRTAANYRLYDVEALWCVGAITELRQLGLTLAEIKEFGAGYLTRSGEPSGPRLAQMLDRSRARVEQLAVAGGPTHAVRLAEWSMSCRRFPDTCRYSLRSWSHALNMLALRRDAVPDPQQARIGELRKVKLRLGRFGREGEQKGVDLRIGLDLVTHARNGAADVFLLVSGDDDLTEAVEEAQGHGVEVVVLAVPDAGEKPHGVSRHLLRAADDLDLLAGSVIDETVVRVEVSPKPEPATCPRRWL